MRYWPLTAVLLAFWLGRETNADKEDQKIGEFDEVRARVVRAETVLLSKAADREGRRGNEPGSTTMELAHSGLAVVDATGTKRVLLGHSTRGSVLVFMQADGSRRVALLDEPRVAGLVVASKDKKQMTLVSESGVETK